MAGDKITGAEGGDLIADRGWPVRPKCRAMATRHFYAASWLRELIQTTDEVRLAYFQSIVAQDVIGSR
jgi:hypothetical protein